MSELTAIELAYAVIEDAIKRESDPLLASAMKAALKALRAPQQSGWMKIESAPRDGSIIMLYQKRGYYAGKPTPPIRICHWKEMPRVGFQWAFYSAPGFLDSPTHWMPLPPPPQSAITEDSDPALRSAETTSDAAEDNQNRLAESSTIAPGDARKALDVEALKEPVAPWLKEYFEEHYNLQTLIRCRTAIVKYIDELNRRGMLKGEG